MDARFIGAPICWRTVTDFRPLIRAWPEKYAVYNPLSGHTHLLDLVAGDMLVAVDREPQSLDSLCQAVAASMDMPLDEGITKQVVRMLEHLDELGLIEPVPTRDA